jgi:hypothetical protein
MNMMNQRWLVHIIWSYEPELQTIRQSSSSASKSSEYSCCDHALIPGTLPKDFNGIAGVILIAGYSMSKQHSNVQPNDGKEMIDFLTSVLQYPSITYLATLWIAMRVV